MNRSNRIETERFTDRTIADVRLWSGEPKLRGRMHVSASLYTPISTYAPAIFSMAMT
jgi:hypothetical protein